MLGYDEHTDSKYSNVKGITPLLIPHRLLALFSYN